MKKQPEGKLKKECKIERAVWLIPNFLFVFFGYWTIGCHISVALELPYNVLQLLFGLSVVMTICTLHLVNLRLDNCGFDSVKKDLPNFRFSRLSLLIISILCIYISVLYTPYSITWVLMFAIACFSYRFLSGKTYIGISDNKNCDISFQSATYYLFGITFIVVLITSLSVRPDADDAFYLSIITQALDYPLLPVLKFDPFYGLTDTAMPAMRMVHTYELLVATFAQLLSIDHLLSYYIIFPIISCITFSLIFFSLYRQLFYHNVSALFALVFLIIILLCWGDGHRTLGNFSFVRFFQGKSLLITIFIPTVVGLLLLYFTKGSLKYLYLLLFVAVGATGTTVNAILILPISITMVLMGVLVSYPRKLVSKHNLLLFPLIIGYPLFLAVLIKYNPNGEMVKHFGPSNFLHQYQDTTKVLGTVIGSNGLNLRSSIILGCLALASSLFPEERQRRLIGAMVLVFLVLLFLPGHPTQIMLANYASMNLVWRLIWVVPLPFIAAACLGTLANSCSSKYQIVFIGIFLTLFAIGGNWTVSKANKTNFSIQRHKLNSDDYSDARYLVNVIDSKKLLLAPENILVALNVLRNSPPKLIVRAMYLNKFPPEQKKDYLTLLRVVSQPIYHAREREIVDKLGHYGVETVVFKRKNGIEKELLTEMIAASYQCDLTYRNYTICSM